MKYKEHTFMFGDTVQGVIRKYNRHDMPDAIVTDLTAEFKKINERHVPRVGEKFKIPLYRFVGQEEPVKQNVTVKKVAIQHKPRSRRDKILAPPPVPPSFEEPEKPKAELINFPKKLEDLDPIAVKIEDEVNVEEIMMDRVERRRLARLKKGKFTPEIIEPEVEEVSVDIEVEEIDEDVKEVVEELGEDPQFTVPKDPILEKPKIEKSKVKKKKTVEKKPKVVDDEQVKKEEHQKKLAERRKNRKKKDIDTATKINRITRSRRRR